MAVVSLRTAAAVVGWAVVVLAAGEVGAGGRDMEPPVRRVEARVRGTVGISSEGLLEERFRVPPSLRAALEQLEPGASVALTQWPVAPGEHRPIRLERRSIYAAGARVFEIGDSGIRELPRSPRIHYLGVIEDEVGGGILLTLDPRTGRLSGAAFVQGVGFDLIADDPGDAASVRVVATDERMAPLDPTWDCGGELLHLPDTPGHLPPGSPASAGAKSGVPLEAVIGVDTDTELLSQKFGNNSAAAADYIADLFAAMNVMYERDLDLTLLQGTTFLRTGSDPYSQNSGGSASSSELNEFGSYWKNHYPGVSRALAAMLSGKSPSSSSASGIAWVGGLCSSSYGYSFSKVFKIDYLSGDAKIVGHELGHNFGSPHTHCYSPPIDHCWNGEGGCYSGATSCPGGPGTLMSYCHLVGCGSALQFHPTVVARILNSYVAPATGVCVFEASRGGDEIFSDSFEGGGTDSWSAASE